MTSKILTSETRAKIKTLKGGWRIADTDEIGETVSEVFVSLTLQGHRRSGFHIIMRPENLGQVDIHCDSLYDAKETVEELFGVKACDWESQK